ncbi:MAG: type II toxin-antitoxin system VapC family toxin [Limisphaerales bacterium]
MYLDTAILVKLFAAEPDSKFFVELTNGQNISSSVLSYTEIYAAMLRKERSRELTKAERLRGWTSFEMQLSDGTIELAPFHEALFKKANRIMEHCSPKIALRSLDALHLATCDRLQDWPLCTTDVRMRQAAELLRFPLTENP